MSDAVTGQDPAPESRVGQMIRSKHPYAYRSGMWAHIEMVVPARGRDCWLVRFMDEATDLWPCDADAAQYEFAPGTAVRDGGA